PTSPPPPTTTAATQPMACTYSVSRPENASALIGHLDDNSAPAAVARIEIRQEMGPGHLA
ncbi:hypothetical protein, partial [Nonomuraea sp. NPDC049158]|uniref:hypothetical protein n=1 Tax=Nonomuraea sp. NPDC049158 TaxID=3155649 RepID=UPI003400EB39